MRNILRVGYRDPLLTISGHDHKFIADVVFILTITATEYMGTQLRSFHNRYRELYRGRLSSSIASWDPGVNFPIFPPSVHVLEIIACIQISCNEGRYRGHMPTFTCRGNPATITAVLSNDWIHWTQIKWLMQQLTDQWAPSRTPSRAYFLKFILNFFKVEESDVSLGPSWSPWPAIKP